MKMIDDGGVTSAKGFLASGIHCGIKKNSLKYDLGLIYSEVPAIGAGVYTKNKVKGAPLYVTKEHLSNKKARAIIVNSGNANTCNGDDGLDKARKMCSIQGKELGIKGEEVLVASTGVIGVPLNIDAIKNGIPNLTASLSKDGSDDAAKAIMTTDTFKKNLAVSVELDGKEVIIGAICKGSGMIEPNMGTMLSFITTDANISPKLLNQALKACVNSTYNRVSIDGDTSTNDMVVILSNGLAGNTLIAEENDDYFKFLEALKELNTKLSRMIAKDGEGATKLIECVVKGAKSEKDAVKFSKSVINSSLVKTAMFGSDANWGRVLCALGYAKKDFNPNTVDLVFKSKVGEILVCKDGKPVGFDEDKAKEILLEDEVIIDLDLKLGDGVAVTWGCDLSYEYVRINGDYRS